MDWPSPTGSVPGGRFRHGPVRRPTTPTRNFIASIAMAEKNKVVWSEGMFLRPQHFQQFERYLEGMLQQRAVALQGFFWGFSHLALDRDALSDRKSTRLNSSH